MGIFVILTEIWRVRHRKIISRLTENQIWTGPVANICQGPRNYSYATAND